ncbi:hypothetical protein SAMN05444172_4683 [Burkholderia sp. GAS332]|nr:hypothetical protein SAMN05444172_4683 [Burkholderia sp. GAS332]
MPFALRLGLLMAGVAEGVRYQLQKPRSFSESGVRPTTGKRYKVHVCPSQRVATTRRQWSMKGGAGRLVRGRSSVLWKASHKADYA